MVLVAEAADAAGQRLEAFFSYHDVYAPAEQGGRRVVGQRRSVSPGVVRQVILAALSRTGAAVELVVRPQGGAMKQAGKAKTVQRDPSGDDPIAAYSQAQPLAFRTICDLLRELIDTALPKATSKVWHGSPVWFIDDKPVVGYNATAKTVNLLFWNGQAFGEAGFKPVGKYRAAQAMFGDAAEIDPKEVRRWLKKAKSDVFDSKAFFRKLREGK
jgi:hypothetical protein